MRLVIGLICFWVSTIGYLVLLNKKTKLPYELLLPLWFTVNGIIMFFAGILNILKLASILLCISGIVIFIYHLVKKKIKFKELITTNTIIFLVVILYLTLVTKNMHLLHYDNFSHWGLIIKTMFIKDALPNFEDTIIMFKDYQPGSAVFIYYIGLLLGKTESSMILGQNYLIASYFFSLLIFTKNLKKDKIKSILSKLIILAGYLFILIGNIKFNDLLVDTLLSVMLIYSFVLMYYFKDDLKKAFIYILPVSVYMFLVKNTGIVFVGFNCLGLLYLGIINKKFKKSFIYAMIVGISSLVVFYIWSRHVTYVYGTTALSSKHSLSAQNIIGELRAKGKTRIFEFIKLYFNHFFEISKNIGNMYMIGINATLVSIMIAFKKKWKSLFKLICGVDLIYIMYWGILGLMYLLSMPWNEASNLSSFDRYMMTIVISIIGLSLIAIIDLVKDEKSKSKIIIVSILIIAIILSVNIKYNFNKSNELIGDQDYEKTTAYTYDKTLHKQMFIAKEGDYYYIYAPKTSLNDAGYLHFLSRYKLNTLNYKVVDSMDDFSKDIDEKYNEKIIVFDKEKQIKDYIKDNNYIKKDKIYTK